MRAHPIDTFDRIWIVIIKKIFSCAFLCIGKAIYVYSAMTVVVVVVCIV